MSNIKVFEILFKKDNSKFEEHEITDVFIHSHEEKSLIGYKFLISTDNVEFNIPFRFHNQYTDVFINSVLTEVKTGVTGVSFGKPNRLGLGKHIYPMDSFEKVESIIVDNIIINKNSINSIDSEKDYWSSSSNFKIFIEENNILERIIKIVISTHEKFLSC